MTTDWYTPAQFATQVNLPASSIRARCHSGEIRATRIGRQYRIPASVLSQWQGEAADVPKGGIDKALVREIRRKLDAHLVEVAKLNQLLAELEN
jgi:excisionase family DNA binding protein